MNDSPSPPVSKTIETVEGRGWKEVYEVMPNGDKVLLWSTSDKKENVNEATAVTITENLSWSDFCKRYRNPGYHAH